MKTKRCNRCGISKEISLFYKNKLMPDGRLNQCVECVRKAQREFRLNNPEHVQSWEKERQQSEHRKNWRVENQRGWRQRNVEKYKARTAVSNAVRDGRLEKKGCEVCGDKAQAHHEDYSKPLQVRWLCFKHHREEHAI
jgi:hypothetical protein